MDLDNVLNLFTIDLSYLKSESSPELLSYFINCFKSECNDGIDYALEFLHKSWKELHNKESQIKNEDLIRYEFSLSGMIIVVNKFKCLVNNEKMNCSQSCELAIRFPWKNLLSSSYTACSCVDLMQLLDMIIIIAGPRYQYLETIIDWIQAQRCVTCKTYSISVSNIPSVNTKIIENPPRKLFGCGAQIKSMTNLSILEFSNNMLEPLVILHSIDHWPALSAWKNLHSVKEVAGHRIVPIEAGNSYTDESFHFRLQTLGEYIDCLDSEDAPYLAQHALFDQISSLRRYINVPDYCYVDPNPSSLSESDSNVENEMALVRINAWLGPANTVSNLHWDASYNVLAQVLGRKYVRLYSPCYSSKLNPFAFNHPLFNTSQLDICSELLSGIPYYEVILNPGDCLFIPPFFWHYVQSLEKSLSISFWWNAQKIDPNCNR